VSSDNKGMAAWMYKSEFPATTPLLQGSFNVSHHPFFLPSCLNKALEANVGDITPNT
jgi:hypothetical protein